MIDNIRFALRQIHKNPGFAALAILTLALGIGANTAMFTVIDSVMLRPLPYRDADRIVAVTPGAASEGNTLAAERGEHKAEWVKHLSTNVRAYFKQSYRWLLKNDRYLAEVISSRSGRI